MRKLCVRYKWLMLFLLISVVIVISYYASYNLPELFPGAGRLFDFAYQISIGYIINFIFFLLNVFHPQIEAENKSVKACQLPLVTLLEEIRSIENIFTSFINLKYGSIAYPVGITYYQYPDSESKSYIDITAYLKNEYAVMQHKFSVVVSNRYFGSLDTKIIELVNDLQYSGFMHYLKHFTNYDGDLDCIFFGTNSYITTLEDSYKQFIKTAKELQELANARVSPTKRFLILEGAARNEYIDFIKEKRASIPLDRNKYSEYHIEGKRIY